MQRFLVLVVLLIISVSVYAQKTKPKSDGADNKDLSKYLDDGRIGNVSNLVRFRVGRALTGYLGASYERKFSRKFGLEGGVYYKPFKGIFFEDYRFSDYGYNDGKQLSGINGGIAFMIYPKMYITGKKINNGYFFGLRAMNANFKADLKETYFMLTNSVQKDVKVSSSSFAITAGSHQHVASRFVFGLEWGFVFIEDTYKKVNKMETDQATQVNYMAPSDRNIKAYSFDFTFDMTLGVLF